MLELSHDYSTQTNLIKIRTGDFYKLFNTPTTEQLLFNKRRRVEKMFRLPQNSMLGAQAQRISN